MNRRLFADTSGLYAVAAAENQRHAPAVRLLETASSLVTTRFIVLETVSLITKRRSARDAKDWYERFLASPSVSLREPEPKLLRLAEEFWRKHEDKDWDLIDCYSFIVMRHERLTSVLTFDRHFRQAGFRIIEEE
ncbi:MAG: type II toxin-antitoxin system VapC family toxin [Verrucomicrobia bacterium]|nr:type II toxin-antitoxin system VapC family toxin [Verrucomicrobiota bacterium]